MYHQGNSGKCKRMESLYVLPEDNSASEIQCYSNFRETEAYLTENEKQREGPSCYTYSKARIPESLLGWKGSIIVGYSDIYTNLYLPRSKFLWEDFLNMSPPVRLSYSGKLDHSNTLLKYLEELVQKLGDQGNRPVILVEFFSQDYEAMSNLSNFVRQCTTFINTLVEIQKTYAGMVMGICPPPYWTIGTSLTDYRQGKNFNRKIAECLSLIGYCRNIYVSAPLIGSLPVYHPTYEGCVGYTGHRKFQRVPLFNTKGEYTCEAGNRALNGIRADIKMMRQLEAI